MANRLGRLGGAVDADPTKAETLVDSGDRVVARRQKDRLGTTPACVLDQEGGDRRTQAATAPGWRRGHASHLRDRSHRLVAADRHRLAAVQRERHDGETRSQPRPLEPKRLGVPLSGGPGQRLGPHWAGCRARMGEADVGHRRDGGQVVVRFHQAQLHALRVGTGRSAPGSRASKGWSVTASPAALAAGDRLGATSAIHSKVSGMPSSRWRARTRSTPLGVTVAVPRVGRA